MNIVLFGNVANNFYRLGNALTGKPQINVVLLLTDNEESTNTPEHDNPKIIGNYPDWILANRQFRLRNLVSRKKSVLVEELERADIAVLSSINVLTALFTKKVKVVFYATGADLTLFPFWRRHLRVLIDQKGSITPRRIAGLIWVIPLAILMRLSIRRCDVVVAYPFKPFKDAISDLRVSSDHIAQTYLPLAVDTTSFRFREENKIQLSKEIRARFSEFSFKVFAPSRLLTNSHPAYIAMGQFKGNDTLVKAFAEFLKENEDISAGLFLIDRGSEAVFETKKMKELIAQLGIAANVVWLKPVLGNSFDRRELIDMYSLSDVVADDFGVGWFGSVTLEALSCSKPVMCFVDNGTMKDLYPWHPIASFNTKAEIKSFLTKISENPTFARDLGRQGRAWVEEFHSSAAIETSWLALIRELDSTNS